MIPAHEGEGLTGEGEPRLVVVSGALSHCFMGRPFPDSNGAPVPSAINASTRWRGSFTTREPPVTMAKIDPFTLSVSEPKRRRPPSGVSTPG